jgi:hypothetical protein
MAASVLNQMLRAALIFVKSKHGDSFDNSLYPARHDKIVENKTDKHYFKQFAEEITLQYDWNV